MENELSFRTAVGGYRKDEVMEYVENLNDEMFRAKKAHEEEAERLKSRIDALEMELKDKEEILEEQKDALQRMDEESVSLKEKLENTSQELEETIRNNTTLKGERDKEKGEKLLLKEKLAKEVLRLRAENKVLRENWKDAESRAGCKDDYEAVKKAVVEAQATITEYVDMINKTQESLGETYQQMNRIKKKVTEEIEKATKK